MMLRTGAALAARTAARMVRSVAVRGIASAADGNRLSKGIRTVRPAEGKLKPLYYPRGMASFLDLCKDNRFVVDKTESVVRLLEAGGTILLVRPARFGKTTTAEMLGAFLDIGTTEEQFMACFDQSVLEAHPETLELARTHHVLHLVCRVRECCLCDSACAFSTALSQTHPVLLFSGNAWRPQGVKIGRVASKGGKQAGEENGALPGQVQPQRGAGPDVCRFIP